MSYIINNTSPYASIKLTEKGRERLALGQLNFSYWAIGDSEINYDRELLYDDADPSGPYTNVSGATRILRPKDQQPNIKSFITKDNATNLQTMQPANIEVIKAVVNNEADERGFFNYTGSSFTTLSSTTYIVDSQMVSSVVFTGGTQLCISGLTYDVGDRLLIKYINPTVTGQTAFSNVLALPNLWYQIETSGVTCFDVDRDLPDFSGFTGMCQVIVYPSGEVWDIYGSSSVPYWDNGTLSFDACCNVSCSDVPIWNQNNVWCEDPAGFSSGLTYEHYWDFGSYDYLGQKYPYLWYTCQEDGTTGDIICETPGQSTVDSIRKSIGILHYTNNVVSNVYGEFFYIDTANNKTVIVDVPDLMWHRRGFSTASGTTMGMRFVASGATQYIPNSEIEYVPLIEDPTVISVPKTVGKVFPQLKTIVFDDDEIVMATSYKANRNWTLPALSATLQAPQAGGSGVLETDKTMYLTYILDTEVSGGTSGLTTPINCQYYTKISNTTPTIKDVDFKINAVDLLPYMRKIENIDYDGLGFYAYNFKVLWQIVDEPEDRPIAHLWNEFDYTSSAITSTVGETIDPIALENQNPVVNGFLVDGDVATGSTIFDIIPTLNLPLNVDNEKLQLGDERFFYGNVGAYIGATIFKTLFKVNIEASDFIYTSNPTRTLDPNEAAIRISEIGIYDSDSNLVVIAKMSKPMLLENSNTINAELSIDF